MWFLSLKSALFSIQVVFSVPRFAISYFHLILLFSLLFNYYFGSKPPNLGITRYHDGKSNLH